MRLPGWTRTKIALKGAWWAAIAAVFLTLVAIAGVQTARLEGFRVWPISVTGWIETAMKAERERKAEKASHQQTKADYRDAQILAAEIERKRLARVRTQQQEITDAIDADYTARLAGARARAERLQQELRARDAAGGASESIAVPGLPAADRRPSETPAHPRLPPAERTEAVQLDRDLIATEQALQLDALIDWILQQAAVDPNSSKR